MKGGKEEKQKEMRRGKWQMGIGKEREMDENLGGRIENARLKGGGRRQREKKQTAGNGQV